MIKKQEFGKINGEKVYLFKMDNGKGLYAEIISLGGIIKKLEYKNTDVVLGRDTLEEYQNNSGSFGSLIGRNSNRIENAEFELNGKTYKLFKNNGESNLHGGEDGFDQKIWKAKAVDKKEPSLILSYTSPDGEEGFPGKVSVRVTYTLTEDNSIKIHYEGRSNKDTILNMTNHTYFNLNGHASGELKEHYLTLDAPFYTPNTDACIPTGVVESVAGTPFDFTSEANVEERFDSTHEQIAKFGGFDHNLVLSGKGYRKIGALTSRKTGITMEMYTDQKGVQLYSFNFKEEGRICKDGAVYNKHHGICFETQAFPNFTKFSHFPDGFLKKGEKYDTVTAYKFI